MAQARMDLVTSWPVGNDVTIEPRGQNNLIRTVIIHTSKKNLHHLGFSSSGTFIYKRNRDPHKQYLSSFYCS
jgi:hypothetical protein